ncbi:NYN domain-containing protein [Chitinimonas sp. BJYL2]|uniref:NYN domain-containing protein n=1 Tax=Chitinimonas sp. BJYL2 TaxID=2976696 RepID=UPI0022B414AD|nr:NYN domain-containing protein [Chitinimonas sp. BJYL2]
MSIGLFIDGAYAYKAFGREKINYLELRKLIEEDLADTVDEGYFFNADDNQAMSSKLHNALSFPYPKGPGLRVKNYWVQKKQLYWPNHLGGGPVTHPEQPHINYEITTQKAVDVGLVYHMTRSFHKRKWSKLVLFAGDGDFHEPVQNLVEYENVDLYLIGSLNSIADVLRPYARRIIEVDAEPVKSRLRLVDRWREGERYNEEQPV